MNPLSIEILKGLIDENELPNRKEVIGMFGGGFKPPTVGHLEVVKRALDENPEMDKMIILVGSGVRDSISQEESVAIWKIYQKYLGNKVEIIPSPPGKAPIGDIYSYAKKNPNKEIYWFIGAREGNEEDFQDIEKRTRSLRKLVYQNVKVKQIVTGGAVSGTKARQALLAGDKEGFIQFLPDIPEVDQIWDMLSDIMAERISFKPEFTKDEVEFIEDEADSEMRPEIDIDLSSNHFFDRLNDPRNYPDIEPFEVENFFDKLADKKDEFIEFLQKYKEVVAKDRETNINIPFMKIANKAIAKTIMRKKNFLSSTPILPLEEVKPTEDNYTGSYDSETRTYSRYIINQLKDNFGTYYEEEVKGDLKNIKYTLEFKLNPIESGKLGYPPYLIDAAGGKDDIELIINYEPTSLIKFLNDLIAELKETLRHELEHVAQENFEKGVKIGNVKNDEKLALPQYLTLDYEIPAFIRGLNKRAKTKNITLGQAIDEFFLERSEEISPEGEAYVRRKWAEWIRKNLPKTPLEEADPKKGTGKKPKGSGRRLYTDEDPSDTVGIKFSTRQDIVDTLNKVSFKNKSHARQSQIINLIHQRVRAALNRTKDPKKKKRLQTAFNYIKKRKEASKEKTKRLQAQKKKSNENIDPKSQAKHKGKSAPFGSAYEPVDEAIGKIGGRGNVGSRYRAIEKRGDKFYYIQDDALGQGIRQQFGPYKTRAQAKKKMDSFPPAQNYRDLTEIGIDLTNYDGQILPGDILRAPKDFPLGGKKLEKSLQLKVVKNNREGVNRYKLTLEDPKTGKRYSVRNYEMDGEYQGKELPQWGLIRKSKKNIKEDILGKTDLVLPRGQKIILQAEEDDYDRGLIVELSEEGGYKMNYWYGDDIQIYPVEVEVDGESVKPDAIEVYMKFHPYLKENIRENKKIHKIIAKGIVFEPKDITINVGDTVEWINKEGYHNVNGQKSHPRNENNPESFGNEVGEGWTYKFTFTKPGLYKYHCDPHLSADMVGTVKVESKIDEGDTYEKMAAKGKKAGNLKQGTVRKRLNIPKGEKVPMYKIDKEISRLKKMDKDKDKKGVQLGDKNQKYYKALQLAKTLKSTTNLKENLNQELTPQIASLTQYMGSNGLNLKPYPKIKFINNDVDNARDLLGRTAYYDPNQQLIALYTMGRHPKDILRSYAHELIHHHQNLNNTLDHSQTTNTNEDDALDRIEREAYENGNILFRNWEDSIKNEN